MRLLVFSDSHGSGGILDRIIRSESEAKHIFFLGDTVDDIEDLTYEYTDRHFHIAGGNCDGFCGYPEYDIIKLYGVNILYTHGHTFGVKASCDRLLEFAQNVGAQAVLYGHTHKSEIDYKNGVWIVNPGSVSRPVGGIPTYAVIDIKDKEIKPDIKIIGARD